MIGDADRTRSKLEALETHPRIGERSPEQHGDDPEVLAELAELNREYEEKFGFRFIVFVNRRSAQRVAAGVARAARTHAREELDTGAERARRDREGPMVAAVDPVPDRLARPLVPLPARDRRVRLDRDVVLLRRARQPPAPGGRARRRARRRRRVVGDPRRRLLPHREVPRHAADDPGAAALVQVGGVHDVAVGLRAVRRAVLPAAAHVPDRPRASPTSRRRSRSARASRCSPSAGSSTTGCAGRSASGARERSPRRCSRSSPSRRTACRICSRRAPRTSRSARCSARSWSRTSSS